MSLLQDVNLWGIFVVPIGLTICFGPALFVWLKEELRSGASDKSDKK